MSALIKNKSFSLLRPLLVLWFLALIITGQAFSQNGKWNKLPGAVAFVNDFEDLLTRPQEHYLDSLIRFFEKKTTDQIAIVTIDTFMTDRPSFDDYVLRLSNKWGVGQKGKNNGIVIAISKGFRMMRIETGLGLEAVFPDAEAKSIIDNHFLPYFKKGQYFEGISNGLQAIIRKLQ